MQNGICVSPSLQWGVVVHCSVPIVVTPVLVTVQVWVRAAEMHKHLAKLLSPIRMLKNETWAEKSDAKNM